MSFRGALRPLTLCSHMNIYRQLYLFRVKHLYDSYDRLLPENKCLLPSSGESLKVNNHSVSSPKSQRKEILPQS